MAYHKHLDNILRNTLTARQMEKEGKFAMAASYYASANNFKKSREILQRAEKEGNNFPYQFAHDNI